MKLVVGEIIRYFIAGVANTAVGYVTFLLLLHEGRWSPLYANAGSYAVGLTVAYVLNLLFVFSHSSHSFGAILRFLVGFAISYAVNIGVLQLMLSEAQFMPEYAQLFAMVSYTVSFYLFNKYFVWIPRGGKRHALDSDNG